MKRGSSFLFSFVTVMAVGLFGAACGGEDDGGLSPGRKTAEDERGSIGPPSGGVQYCERLGYTLVDETCRFPDGSSCEVEAFFRGECGHAHSYCNQHGGAVSSKTEDQGGWTSTYAVCDHDGRQCKETSFMTSGKCESLSD